MHCIMNNRSLVHAFQLSCMIFLKFICTRRVTGNDASHYSRAVDMPTIGFKHSIATCGVATGS